MISTTADVAQLEAEASKAAATARTAGERLEKARSALLEAKRARTADAYTQDAAQMLALQALCEAANERLDSLRRGLPGRIQAVYAQEVERLTDGQGPDREARQSIRDAEAEIKELTYLLSAAEPQLRVARQRARATQAVVIDPEILAKAPEVCRSCPSVSECAIALWPLQHNGNCEAKGRPAGSQLELHR